MVTLKDAVIKRLKAEGVPPNKMSSALREILRDLVWESILERLRKAKQ